MHWPLHSGGTLFCAAGARIFDPIFDVWRLMARRPTNSIHNLTQNKKRYGDQKARNRSDRTITMKPCRISSQHSVRATIATLLHQGDPSLQRAAHRLGISSRSLQRDLAGMGTSYREIVAEVRLDTACHLLAESDQSIASIAGRLGYSGASSFSRTFMRLMKIPPIVYRRQQAARGINSGSADSSHSARPGRSEQAE